ncbi:MAG TPA: OmpA family protein [Chitinophagales bacterium]|nr:OmpA family protein [Chitinophagales bacterium]
MKVFLSMVILFISPYSALAQDTRKHFEYTDTSFEVGEVKILGNVNYNFDTIYEPPRPQPLLDSLRDFLRLHPQVFIEIACHTDNKGRDEYNLKLSEARARSAYEYLKMKGVPDQQLTFKGYGKAFPIAPNEINGKDNPDGRQQNRRTEIQITYILPSLKSLDQRKHFEYSDTSLEVGEVKILCCIYFGFDAAEIRPESFPHLDSTASFLYYHPELITEVSSHTDSKGNDKYNLKLSQARSQAIVDYFISKGIPKGRLVTKGYGETLPIAPNEIYGKDNPEGRQLNRRMELKIVSIVSPEEKFIRPSILNPEISVTHFLFGENTSAFPLSLFNVRAIENILDKYKQADTSFNTHYKSFTRSYVGFIDAEGDSIVMVAIDFSALPRAQKNSLFDSNALSKTQSLFINLSKRICLKSF